MKRRVLSFVMVVCILMLMLAPITGTLADEEIATSGDLSADLSASVEINAEDAVEAASDEAAEETAEEVAEVVDWAAKAAAVKLSGDWRKDLVAIASSQLGYTEEDGVSLYGEWADRPTADWTAHFINWVATQAGLSEKHFPHGNTYKYLRIEMNDKGALLKCSRYSYPAAGDLALIEKNGQQLVGIVVYVSNGVASVIHGDDHGSVTQKTYTVGEAEFDYYVDLNVLMEKAGIEVGKGGEVPVIPEGGVIAWTNTNAVYMRSEPTTASKRVTTVKKSGTPVTVTGGELCDDGYIWYGVQYEGMVGYIRGDLLTLDKQAIPTATAKPTATPAPVVTATPEPVVTATPEPVVTVTPAPVVTEAPTAAPTEEPEADPTLVPGLIIQDRVVNIEVIEAAAGQTVDITFEIYGAVAYEWHEVAEVTVDDVTTKTDTIIDGATTETLTVTAKSDATYSYYCVATINANGEQVKVTSKTTVVNVDAPIVAEAILGEEINFTYTVEGAATYQWFQVVTPEGSSYTQTTAIAGATSATLTMYADPANVGVLYHCIARDAADAKLGESSNYTYTIDYDNLCKYVEELANMTRVERYEIMTGLWAENYVDESAATTLASAVQAHWEAEHKTVYTTLLCTCETMKSAYSTSHSSGCPWYEKTSTSKVERPVYCDICADMCDYRGTELPESECFHELLKDQTPNQIYNYLSELDGTDYAAYNACRESLLAHADAGDDLIVCPGTSTCAGIFVAPGEEHIAADCPWNPENIQNAALADRITAEPEFETWMETATEEMIARALTVKTLDHVAAENNYLYVARDADPVATVDDAGFVRSAKTNLIIGWIDFSVEDPVFYDVTEIPETAFSAQ